MRVSLVALCALALALPGCLKDVVPGIGGSAEAGPRDFLSDSTYKKWVVEVDAVEGQSAPGEAMATLRNRLEGVANKPDGIEFRSGDTLPARGGTWSDKDLLQLSEANQDVKTSGSTATLHLLFVDGQYEKDGVLGVTYTTKQGNRVIASGPVVIFSESIRQACAPVVLVSPCVNVNTYWSAVLVHEFGHSLGLVNNGVPMQRDHEDADNAGHSSNQDSVMYWAVEKFDVTNVFGGGGPPTTFDADDKADLCAAGGKCS